MKDLLFFFFCLTFSSQKSFCRNHIFLQILSHYLICMRVHIWANNLFIILNITATLFMNSSIHIYIYIFIYITRIRIVQPFEIIAYILLKIDLKIKEKKGSYVLLKKGQWKEAFLSPKFQMANKAPIFIDHNNNNSDNNIRQISILSFYKKDYHPVWLIIKELKKLATKESLLLLPHCR